MNLPNKLTLMRVFLIPVFVTLFFLPGIAHGYLWALAVFALAALTDMADGIIARKRGLVTDFGALMDPLADKLLVMSAMVCFVEVQLIKGWVVIVILAREFLVTSIRLVAAGKGTVIAADRWGKLKTVCQMLWICLGLLYLWLNGLYSAFPYLNAAWNGFLLLTLPVLLFTVLSGANYVLKNRNLFADM